MSKVDKLLSEFVERYGLSHIKTPQGTAGNPGARVLDALAAGEPLVAMAEFKANGRVYRVGEILEVDPEYGPRLAKMAELGYILPASEYNRSKAFHEVKKFRDNVVDPKWQRLNQMRTKLALLAGEVEEAEIAAEAARVKYSDLQGQIAGAELELQAILEPEMLQEI